MSKINIVATILVMLFMVAGFLMGLHAATKYRELCDEMGRTMVSGTCVNVQK